MKIKIEIIYERPQVDKIQHTDEAILDAICQILNGQVTYQVNSEEVKQ